MWAAAAFTGAIGWAIRQRVRIHAVLTTAAEDARRAIAAAAEAAAQVIYLNVITTGKVARSAMVVAKPTPDGQRVRAELRLGAVLIREWPELRRSRRSFEQATESSILHRIANRELVDKRLIVN